MRRSNLIESEQGQNKMRINIGVLLVAVLIIITCVLLIL